MDTTLSRRRLLSVTGSATTVALAGCADDYDDDEVTWVERQPAQLDDASTEPIEVRVLVHNIGAPNDVQISLEIIDLDGEVMETVMQTEFFERDEQRNVFIEITPGARADYIQPSVEIV